MFVFTKLANAIIIKPNHIYFYLLFYKNTPTKGEQRFLYLSFT